MAGIIKANRQSGSQTGIQTVAFNLDDINYQADAYIGQVRQQAATIVAQANDQAKQLRQDAQQQGRDAALQDARRMLEARLDERLDTLLPALQQAIESIQQAKDAWQKNWQQKAVHLAVAIAQRLIHRELRQSPDISIDVLREALELAAGQDHIRLHLNPQDHETAGNRVQKLVDQLSRLGTVEFVPDADVPPGGCLVKTEFGEIDHRFEAQLVRIEEELSDV